MTRRAPAALLAALLLFAAGCADDAEPGASPPPSSIAPSVRPTPAVLDGASCERQSGGSDENLPDFVEVIPSHVEGIDRVTFRFEPEDPSVTEAPSYSVQFEDELFTDGEGAPVEVDGEAFVAINFHALGVDLTSETPREIYTGPTEFKTGYPTLLEIEQLGDFEAVITWGLGLARKACFRVVASATEITLEFPSP